MEAPVESVPTAAVAPPVAVAAPIAVAVPDPIPVLSPVHELQDAMGEDHSATDIVPTLTELFRAEEAEQAQVEPPQAIESAVEASASIESIEPHIEPIESVTEPVAAAPSAEEEEFEVEFGADELGAAAPREAVRVEEHEPAPASILDVAAMTPELVPDDARTLVEQHVAPALPPGREQQAPERQEFARVDADLLDTLLNNAGEVSIFRSRLEQQVGSIEFNLAELGRTVTRLREQLRKLELETEAQILHRHQEEHPNRADFDPLELDRYSTIQQLTRAFAESVSDVGSIEGLLENLTR
jgi:chemosensory pili system protein ChpA (sensor histidine kinase/response regulator)